ncbi:MULTISPECIES: sigma factor G inhibitor Gin [Bacillaceae]|uniref:Sigma factor G inhibitor Gin n=1 Tax=Evansella alkalicola TaxID=745819 RepID=A0ABS6JTS2_9BACI|nr:MULTISPECIES: sigma factor G inhibitor Gin [Bacillaceae]MBU9721970.1 sigma factor G inhibitor Gin [Bacillus alkalicola]
MGSLISSKKQDSLQECLICEQERDNGIHLLNYFICKNCESDIVQSETKDQGYNLYVHRLRKVKNALMPTGQNKAN